MMWLTASDILDSLRRRLESRPATLLAHAYESLQLEQYSAGRRLYAIGDDANQEALQLLRSAIGLHDPHLDSRRQIAPIRVIQIFDRFATPKQRLAALYHAIAMVRSAARR